MNIGIICVVRHLNARYGKSDVRVHQRGFQRWRVTFQSDQSISDMKCPGLKTVLSIWSSIYNVIVLHPLCIDLKTPQIVTSPLLAATADM